MDLVDIQCRLEALFSRRQDEPRRFARLWGLRQEPLEVRAEALTRLFQALRVDGALQASNRAHLSAAISELAQNVEAVEGLAASREHPPFAYVTWLWRVTETLRSLAVQLATGLGPAAKPREAPRKKLPAPSPLAEPLPPLPIGERLQGFSVKPLIDLASRETRVLGRRRRLLEAARRALLESAAALKLPAAQVEQQLLAVTAGIQQVTAWQQAGVDADEDVAHQLRRAVQHRNAPAVQELLGVVSQLEHDAPRRHALLARVDVVRRSFSAARTPAPPSLEEASVRTFGRDAAERVLQGAARARRELEVSPQTAVELVQAANAVDASFELGRSVAPVRALEEQRRMAVVPFPTQTMVLQPARAVADLPRSLIEDPRLILYQLATRSLLARRYLAERRQRRSVPTRCSEARYYLLDGSASMAGRRGRMRDAILISELSTMIRHLETGSAAARPVVYYRYFTKHAEGALKVDTVEGALAAIEAVILRPSRGETDIQSALIDSFHRIDQERTSDPNLQRAQLVLITDGIAKVDLWAVWRARAALQGMPIQVSVIALGSESPELKELAATQRARGEQVFYHYLSDRAIYQLMRRTSIERPSLAVEAPDGELAEPSTAPPAAESAAAVVEATDGELAEPSTARPEAEPVAAQVVEGPLHIPIVVELQLWQELDQLVDELAILDDLPDVDELEQAGLLELAYEELGVSLTDRGFEAERARAEALRRDARAVATRFDRWFPEPDTLPVSGQPPPPELLEVIEIVVCSVSELTDYLSGPPLGRRVDAIELLERLLLEAGVSPWAYSRALPHATASCRDALRALRRSAG